MLSNLLNPPTPKKNWEEEKKKETEEGIKKGYIIPLFAGACSLQSVNKILSFGEWDSY